MMMRFSFKIALTFLLMIALFGFTFSKSNNQIFEVYRDNVKVGDLETHWEIQSGCTLYSLTSDVLIDMLIDVKISERISNKYENGKLITASHSRTVNGINQSRLELRLVNGQYVSELGKPLNNTGSWIGASVLGLYHKEPIGITAVYSEGQACWVKLVQQSEGVYKALLPDDKSSTFYYSNGELQKVVAETNWGQVVFQKK